MNFSRISILFVIIFLSVTVIQDIEISRDKVRVEETQRLNRCFNQAVDEAADMLVKADPGQLILQKEKAIDVFFHTLSASLGILSDAAAQQELFSYFPIISVVTDQGVYLYFREIFKRDEKSQISQMQWSECIPYTYEDSDFIYQFTMGNTVRIYDKNKLLGEPDDEVMMYEIDYREAVEKEAFQNYYHSHPECMLFHENEYQSIRQETIADRIETLFSSYVTEHNLMAANFGIAYEFSFPRVDQSEWMRAVDSPSLFILFQGYPVSYGLGETYSDFSFSAASINKKALYYVEQKEWYFLYHREGCPSLTETEELLVFYNVEECARYGAYACAECFPDTGAKMPVK
ncbi:MAG: hypothetical protein E7256_13190 [Lachnospiraceae bacterium]|nr:hypothetical protein [Lachnospiraceae bacterium]